MCVEAAVSKSLPMPVLLGTDVIELHQLLGESTTYPQIKDSMIAATHMPTLWQLQEDTHTRNKKHESGAKPMH